MVVNIVQGFMKIGFSEYEAKAYVALLHSYPSTAYEAAKSSGIPTSKIYEVLSRLTQKGTVLELLEHHKRRYIPIDPEECLERFKAQTSLTLELLTEELSHLKDETNVSYIWNVRSYDPFLHRAERIIRRAKETLLISTWKEEALRLASEIMDAENRGVRIAAVHFGKPEIQFGQIFPHPIEDTIYAEKGGRGFVVVADSREALMGTVLGKNGVEGAWSKNRGFVTLAEDYIKHDIYIMKIVQRFDGTLLETFGQRYAKLRDIFTDEEVKR
jgi:sugar-specific transcriptional regulator TrmB